MVIPSQASRKAGRCRDLTADSPQRILKPEEKVQTTNPKGASKGVAGKHNPLVVGSNPTEGILNFFSHIEKPIVQKNGCAKEKREIGRRLSFLEFKFYKLRLFRGVPILCKVQLGVLLPFVFWGSRGPERS